MASTDRPSSARAASGSPPLTASDASWVRALASSQLLPYREPSSSTRSRCGRALSARPRVISSMPTVSSAKATNGSSCSAEAVERVGCGLQCAVEVVADRQRPGDGQLQRALQVRIVDRSVEPLDGVDRGEGAGVVADLDRRHRPREQHLGPGVLVQRVGPRSQLVDPRPTLGHPVAHLPEQPEHAKHVGERRDVVGEEPADRDAQVLLLDAQSIGPLDLSFRRPADVGHELGEVLGVSPGDVGTGVAGGEPLGGELPHRRRACGSAARRRRRRR